MNLPDFVFIQNSELPAGGELILYTKPPFDLFRVYKFEDSKSESNFILKNELAFCCKVFEEFRITLCSIGNMSSVSEQALNGHNVPVPTVKLLPALANFYEKERIKGNETRLKKFRREKK